MIDVLPITFSFFNNWSVLIIDNMATLIPACAIIFTRFEIGRDVSSVLPPYTLPTTNAIKLNSLRNQYICTEWWLTKGRPYLIQKLRSQQWRKKTESEDSGDKVFGKKENKKDEEEKKESKDS